MILTLLTHFRQKVLGQIGNQSLILKKRAYLSVNYTQYYFIYIYLKAQQFCVSLYLTL
jgi:hypothetical protein